jgi:hypothetical protein
MKATLEEGISRGWLPNLGRPLPAENQTIQGAHG